MPVNTRWAPVPCHAWSVAPSWNTAESAEAVPMVPARIIYPSSALHGITAWEKKIRAIFLKKKIGHVTKISGVSKFFWGTQKIFGDQQNVFGTDLRKNGEPKVNLGSGENIFGHLFFFLGTEKDIFGGWKCFRAQTIFPQTIIYNLGILPHLAKHTRKFSEKNSTKLSMEAWTIYMSARASRTRLRRDLESCFLI